MHDEGVVQGTAKWVALGALFIVPFTPLIVVNSYFFPFITSKAFYFRTLIEIAASAWVILACLDRAYRPRFSWVGVTAVVFVAWMFFADAFALNAAKAFWSNFERMEGWVLLIHLLGFFYVSSAVLRAERKWRAWFLTSVAASAILLGYALLQLTGSLAIHQGSVRVDASFGNSAYFAIYLLFNVFIALWLALTESVVFLRWCLIALAFSEAVLILFTETRGTVLALVGGGILATTLAAVTAGKQVRRLAVGMLLGILLLVGGFYTFRDSAFVQNNHALQRIASISLNDGSTRFTIWHMALRGVLERPILGWGQEGFNYIFNKYYDPALHHQEPWFDRAHNAFIDWLTAGGIPAFLLYLSLFGTAFMLLWRSSELSRPERIALTCALVGYGIHNLFVFDNLYSYVYFFSILALIDSQVARPIPYFDNAPELTPEDGATTVLPIMAVVAFATVWYVNVTGIQVATNLITAISPSQKGVEGNIEMFEQLAAHPAFNAQEVREQLVSFAASAIQSQQVTNEQKQRIALLAINEMQKQVDSYPLDAREHLQLAYLYRIVGDGNNALKHTQTAQTLSPQKQAILIEKGSIELEVGDLTGARTDFNAAYALGPQFPELADYAAAGNIVAGDRASAEKILTNVYGTTRVDSDILGVAYYKTKDWQRLIDLWMMRVEKSDATAQTWFALAAAYYTAGDTASAVKTITTAIERFPEAAAAGAEALKQIQGK